MDLVDSKHSPNHERSEMELSGPPTMEKLSDVHVCKEASNCIDIPNNPKTLNCKIESRVQLDSTMSMSRVCSETEWERGEINGQVRYIIVEFMKFTSFYHEITFCYFVLLVCERTQQKTDPKITFKTET